MTTVATLLPLLSRARLAIGAEKGVQQQLAEHLDAAGVAYEREVRLAQGDVIDFLVDGIGIELKVKGSKRQILRQLERYAASDRVAGLILFSNVAMGLPDTICGKPAAFSSIGSAWL